MRIIRPTPGPNWNPNGDTVVQVSSPDAGALRLTTFPPTWEQSIDVSHGDRDLDMVHAEVFGLTGAMLLMVCAEHYRGASLHNHAVWAVSSGGDMLWNRPWLCSDSVAGDGDVVWLIRHVGDAYQAPGAMPLEIHALNVRTGEPVAPARRLRLPAALRGRYRENWQINASFARRDGHVVVIHREFRTEPSHHTVDHCLATIETPRSRSTPT